MHKGVERYRNEETKPLAGGAFYQHTPFFFTPEGAPLDLVGTYRGTSAFLIGCGPSFKSVDKTKLDWVWTMTLNNGISSYRSNANCSLDDPSRFNYSMWIDPRIQKFVPSSSYGRKLWDNRLLRNGHQKEQRWCRSSLKVADCPNVIGFRRNYSFDAASFLYEDAICWGSGIQRPGARSVMLAALRVLFLLGFRQIYLLGVDFDISSGEAYHFKESKSERQALGNMGAYAILRGWLTELQPYFLNERFIVKNCNPMSQLEVFPFLTLDEALAEATQTIGDYASEKTEGMYQPKGDEPPFRQRHRRLRRAFLKRFPNQ